MEHTVFDQARAVLGVHERVERIMCRAETLGPVTAEHQFSGQVSARVLHCTREQHPDGTKHRDATCCWSFHEFGYDLATRPENRDESRCAECNGAWPCETAALAQAVLDAPLAGVSIKRRWKPGERVEYVAHFSRGETRPGTVVAVQDLLCKSEHLIVKFDDGEERAINPDVMRHIR